MEGGSTLRIVAGAIGGGAPETLTLTKPTTHKTSSTNLPSLPSSSSSLSPSPSSPSSSSFNPNFPVSSDYAAPLRPSSNSCLCHGRTCRCNSVDGREDKLARESFYKIVFGPVPSRFEVENAVAALQSFMRGISSSGSELDNFQRRIVQSSGYGRVYDAFRLLQTEPAFQRMIVSLSSDKAVWDAVSNNKVVRELRESIYTAEEGRPQSPNEEPDLATRILVWILDIAKAKIMELIENFMSLVNEIVQPPEGEIPTSEITDQLEGKLRSSVFLSIVILLIVVVTRTQRV